MSRRARSLRSALAGVFLATASIAMLGCEAKPASEKAAPAGTPTDPVEVCTRLADVCRYQGSQLGVCVQPTTPKPASCEGREPCYVCAPQH